MSAPTIRLDGGKYTFSVPAGDWRPHILRHGQPWVVVDQGCNAVVALMYAADAAKTIVSSIDAVTKREGVTPVAALDAIRELIAAYNRSGL